MRVLIIHNAGNAALPSGESVVLERDVAGLRAAGIDVDVEIVSFDGTRPTASAASDLFWSRKAFSLTRDRIREFRPHVLHAHGVLPALSTSVFDASRSAGVATVQTLHNYRWLCVEGGLLRDGRTCDDCVGRSGLAGVVRGCARHSRLLSLALAANNAAQVRSGRLSRLVDRFVAVSAHVRSRHIAGGFVAEKIVVRRNTVERVGQAHEPVPKSICFVGRLDRGKGADLLPDLASALGDHTLEVIGSGPLQETLERRSRDLPSLVLRGRLSRADVTAALSRSALAVVPSRAAETFGLSAAEAMACGVPVVASDRGALPELIADSGGGVVCSPNVGALATAIRQLSGSPERSAAVGSAGRRFAQAELSPELGAQRLLAIYRAIARSDE